MKKELVVLRNARLSVSEGATVLLSILISEFSLQNLSLELGGSYSPLGIIVDSALKFYLVVRKALTSTFFSFSFWFSRIESSNRRLLIAMFALIRIVGISATATSFLMKSLAPRLKLWIYCSRAFKSILLMRDFPTCRALLASLTLLYPFS